MFSGLPPKADLPPILELLPPPALRERRDRGLARRRVAARWCAVLVMAESERPYPRRAYRRCGGMEDAAADSAIGEHVGVVIWCFAPTRPRSSCCRMVALVRACSIVKPCATISPLIPAKPIQSWSLP